MKKILMRILFAGTFLTFALAFGSEGVKEPVNFGYDKKIYGTSQIEAIKGWGLDSPTSGVVSGSVLGMDGLSAGILNNGEKIRGIAGIAGLGEAFTILQHKIFAPTFAGIVILVILAFFLHYKIIGAKKFPHHGRKFKVFSKYNVLVHWGAAVPFCAICLTGLMMVFGDKLGGGALIRLAKHVHFFSTFVFGVFGVLMFLMWVKPALFRLYDVGWMKVMGGYLSMSKTPVPAGKFNAGQKAWFWLATLGGFLMAGTGMVMHFLYGDVNFLRLNAIIHNVLGFAVIGMLITHIYMAVFAIEGALESILTGDMGEEELAIMHGYYYKELLEGKQSFSSNG